MSTYKYLPNQMSGKIIEKDMRKFEANGNAAVEFTFVIQKKWKDKETGELKEKPAYFGRCTAYGAHNVQLADSAIQGKYMSVLTMYPQEDKWLDAATNTQKYKTKFVVDKIQNVTYENNEWHVVSESMNNDAPF